MTCGGLPHSTGTRGVCMYTSTDWSRTDLRTCTRSTYVRNLATYIPPLSALAMIWNQKKKRRLPDVQDWLKIPRGGKKTTPPS